ncbi:hypothetical protein [Vibrio sp. DNB22_19_2]
MDNIEIEKLKQQIAVDVKRSLLWQGIAGILVVLGLTVTISIAIVNGQVIQGPIGPPGESPTLFSITLTDKENAKDTSTILSKEQLGASFPARNESLCGKDQIAVGVMTYTTEHDACKGCTYGVRVICKTATIKGNFD